MQACKLAFFLLAAKTLQKANANGGNGGNGVDLGSSYPDSFALYGALAGTLLDGSTRAPKSCPAR